ncbi:hypothetical protein H6F88_31650 [Oculatella sp. FACHB-28]|uniref:hypothetical protein n=1 Tax=Oculatella sp. FACHB-28 TaxID=2692845 RepID=UPI0016877345|nr:hypothetical protein [Oculatella sp. FACHB-28]MBD2060498.1 hypothetical protein [Oculatella sp. FACHB-28]
MDKKESISHRKLTDTETAFLLLLAASRPNLIQPQVSSLLQERYGRTISSHGWMTFKERNADKIEELRNSTTSQIDAAFSCGLITLSNPLNRLKQLEDLVAANTEGYQQEVATKDGSIFNITRKDHRVALQALKQIKEELTELGIKEEPEDLSLTISLAQSPEQEDVSELLEQEGISLEDL